MAEITKAEIRQIVREVVREELRFAILELRGLLQEEKLRKITNALDAENKARKRGEFSFEKQPGGK